MTAGLLLFRVWKDGDEDQRSSHADLSFGNGGCNINKFIDIGGERETSKRRNQGTEKKFHIRFLFFLCN